jgi:hypothetical protein
MRAARTEFALTRAGAPPVFRAAQPASRSSQEFCASLPSVRVVEGLGSSEGFAVSTLFGKLRREGVFEGGASIEQLEEKPSSLVLARFISGGSQGRTLGPRGYATIPCDPLTVITSQASYIT